ncbi:MAG: DAK2 domain-containing protein [Solobacterium sp.]|nr:DAK2 domain-containing protein [Solobacterium sp.]
MEQMNGQILKQMLESGCNNLSNKKAEVDALNVFPVPDGDTGTNMYLTFSNGVSEALKSGSESIPVLTKTLSRGLLMGARGNSGVILSQIFRGFYQSVKEKEVLTAQDFAAAMSNGTRLAYKAVMKPVEGTILTVVRESSESGEAYMAEHPEASVEELVDVLCSEAKRALDETPELLPVLKEAHVVDSGGAGLLTILEGFRACLQGNPIQPAAAQENAPKEDKTERSSGYRTEYILKLNEKWHDTFDDEKYRKNLHKFANKVTVIVEDGVVKVRCNTMTPGDALTLGQRYGEFTKIQIQNIQDDLLPTIIEEDVQEEKEFGMIAVAAGDGLKKLFKDYRVDYIVSGGQTMNPSTEDFVSAFKKVHARHIFVFPNNSNIIMAARQAAYVTKDKDIIVFETKSVMQGISACVSFNPDADLDTNRQAMEEAIANVVSGSVTYAIKDTSIDGTEIHAGDYMSIREKDIIHTSKDKIEAAKYLIDHMTNEDTELITILQGEDATDEDCASLREYIEENYDADVEVQAGGQPVYCFIIGAE